MNAAGTLLRRGFEAAVGDKDGQSPPINLPGWGVLMLGTTAAIFFGIMFMIEYTFGRVLPTLLMIESPQEAIGFEPLPTEDPDSTINKDPEDQASRPPYITASFRRTLKLLQSVGGFRGRFRGFSIFVVNAMLAQWIASILTFIPFVPRGVAGVIAAVILAQFSLAWTQIVISEPSPKTWFRRLPSAKTWRKVAIPTAVLAIAEQIAVLVPLYLAMVAGLTQDAKVIAHLSPHERTMMSLEGFGIFALGVVLSFLLVVPANVTLTRVQASLLPDTEETIVPFDRSFAGKVIPEIVGGSGAIGMLDAWKTFDWSSRIRLVKAYAKVFAIQTVVTILFAICLVSQLFIIVGKDLSKVFPDDDNKDL